MIYFDNSATSFPKPPCVPQAVSEHITNIGASSGRSGHKLALKSGKVVLSCRERLAGLFNVKNSSRIVFTSGATESLNTAILGLMNNGDEVVVTSMEHNSVMRPLRYLEREKSIIIKIAKGSKTGEVSIHELKEKITDRTRLIVINHVSNITGSIIELDKIRDIKKKALLLVDAAQSAGIVPIDVERDGIDLLAFTGHKGLMGVTGTGGLYVREGVPLRPLKFGGTGSISESEEQPDFYPDIMESGTLNITGIFGLNASLGFILETSIDKILKKEKQLTSYFIEQVEKINDVELYGPCDPEKQLPVFSFNIKRRDPAEISFLLDRKFEIFTRVGLHCSPCAHRTIGTYPQGTVRASLGNFNTTDEIDFFASSLKRIVKI